MGYLLRKDDDLQNWCEKSLSRQHKKIANWFGKEA